MKMIFTRCVLAVLLLGMTGPLLSQDLKINEIMASNSQTIGDVDRDSPDWIELYNDSDTAVDLTGFGLSDDPDNPFRWIFPAILMDAHAHLLIFASGKDRRFVISHWETLIDWGDSWRYHLGDSTILPEWNTTQFNDSTWAQGPSGFGCGDGDDATVVDTTNSVFMRKVFTVDDPGNIVRAALHIDYEDAFVAYLNGTEIARANIGTSGVPVPYDQSADDTREAQIYQNGLPELYNITTDGLLREGSNLLAIQVHNASAYSSDLSLIPFFSVAMIEPPEIPGGHPELLDLPLQYLHSNFKISSAGEPLVLTDTSENPVDYIAPIAIGNDISWGRQPDGSDQWVFFAYPTPGQSNTGGHVKIPAPEFSQAAGYYTESFSLVLSSSNEQDTIRFTRDGSEPDSQSSRYTEPLWIAPRSGDSNYFSMIAPNHVLYGPSVWYPPDEVFKISVIRARSFGTQGSTSDIVTNSYCVTENMETRYDLPLISLSTDEENFFSDSTGIYVPGDSYIAGDDNTGNYFGSGSEWERPANFEFFDVSGQRQVAAEIGVRIHGGASRVTPQKALRLYGRPSINYPFFPDKDLSQFRRLLLRNSGNDRVTTMLRDAFMIGLVRDMGSGLEYQASLPAVVFINGEFWGIHNIRERIDKYFIADNFGVDADEVDYLEKHGELKDGNDDFYWQWYNFLESADMTQPSNYDSIATMMDIENFIDYNIAEIFFANVDWPSNNRDFWRPSSPNGKFRWIIYDLDFGFGWTSYSNYDHNTLAFATVADGPTAPPPWASNRPFATLQLRKMLQNQHFRWDFVNRFADLMNTVFRPSHVISRLDSLAALYDHVMPDHVARWAKPESYEQWQSNLEHVREFARRRPSYMRRFICEYFNALEPLAENIRDTVSLTLNINNPERGSLRVNTIRPATTPWTGIYFTDIPITIEAYSRPGYRFSGWDGLDSSTSRISVILSGDSSFSAIFENDPDYRLPLVINEFMAANNTILQDEYGEYDDWIELYNPNDETVDAGGYTLTDDLADPDKYSIPTDNQATLIPPGGFLLLWADGDSDQGILHLNFRLSRSGEKIGLYRAGSRVLADSIHFGAQNDDISWGRYPDGEHNWQALSPTPGASNQTGTGVAHEPVPKSFRLDRNYPNPFNPITTIPYEIPRAVKVTLTVFDLQGRVIATIVDQYQPAGYYRIQWDATGQSSGIYLYRIVAGDFQQIRKCILMK